jgi:outer membrane protein assembly factor BamD
MKKLIAFSILALLLAGCASDDKELTDSAEADYKEALHMMDAGRYGQANMFLEKYGAKHPYSQYLPQAETLRIYAAYKNEEYILSETLSGRFIDRHPRSRDIAYARYMLALSLYKQVNDPSKEQATTHKAVKAFETLAKEHPDSQYTRDARPRMQKLYNSLAAHELLVGKFYFKKERYVAAANRFAVVLDNYQTTPSIEEALYYLAESYARLGVKQSAREMAILLRHNYPKSEWSDKAAELL